MRPGKLMICIAVSTALLLLASICNSEPLQTPTTIPTATSPSASQPADPNDLVKQALARHVKEVNFQDKKFGEFLDWFRKETGLNIHANWTALKSGEVIPDTPVTIAFKDASYEKILQLVLLDISTATKIMYVIDNGMVMVSTKDDFNKSLILRVVQLPEFFVDPVEASVFAPAKPRCISICFPEEEPGPDPKTPKECFMETLRRAIDKDSWEPTGNATIFWIDDWFVINQTYENWQAIEAMLRSMDDAARARRVRLGIAVVRYTKSSDRKMMMQEIGKAADIQAALRKGEEAGTWTLDRCRIYDTMLNRRVECYRSSVADGKSNPRGQELTLPGYFIEAVPKHKRDGITTIALDHASAWQLDKAPTVETSRESLHVRLKEGAFEAIDLAPVNAKDGGLTMLIWLAPKE